MVQRVQKWWVGKCYEVVAGVQLIVVKWAAGFQLIGWAGQGCCCTYSGCKDLLHKLEEVQ